MDDQQLTKALSELKYKQPQMANNLLTLIYKYQYLDKSSFK